MQHRGGASVHCNVNAGGISADIIRHTPCNEQAMNNGPKPVAMSKLSTTIYSPK